MALEVNRDRAVALEAKELETLAASEAFPPLLEEEDVRDIKTL